MQKAGFFPKCEATVIILTNKMFNHDRKMKKILLEDHFKIEQREKFPQRFLKSKISFLELWSWV